MGKQLLCPFTLLLYIFTFKINRNLQHYTQVKTSSELLGFWSKVASWRGGSKLNSLDHSRYKINYSKWNSHHIHFFCHDQGHKVASYWWRDGSKSNLFDHSQYKIDYIDWNSHHINFFFVMTKHTKDLSKLLCLLLVPVLLTMSLKWKEMERAVQLCAS